MINLYNNILSHDILPNRERPLAHHFVPVVFKKTERGHKKR